MHKLLSSMITQINLVHGLSFEKLSVLCHGKKLMSFQLFGTKVASISGNFQRGWLSQSMMMKRELKIMLVMLVHIEK